MDILLLPCIKLPRLLDLTKYILLLLTALSNVLINVTNLNNNLMLKTKIIRFISKILILLNFYNLLTDMMLLSGDFSFNPFYVIKFNQSLLNLGLEFGPLFPKLVKACLFLTLTSLNATFWKLYFHSKW